MRLFRLFNRDNVSFTLKYVSTMMILYGYQVFIIIIASIMTSNWLFSIFFIIGAVLAMLTSISLMRVSQNNIILRKVMDRIIVRMPTEGTLVRDEYRGGSGNNGDL